MATIKSRSVPIICTTALELSPCAVENAKLYLVVNTDKYTQVFCASCIERNSWDVGTLFFEIGDDVTHHFL